MLPGSNLSEFARLLHIFQVESLLLDDIFLHPHIIHRINNMNDATFQLAAQPGLVDSAYMRQASQARRVREKMIQTLLAQVTVRTMLL